MIHGHMAAAEREGPGACQQEKRTGESGQIHILTLKSDLLWTLVELPQVPATSHCRRYQTWTLEVQINSCANQRETTGLKAASVQPKDAVMFLAVLWSIMKVHTNHRKNHSRYTVQDLKSGGFGSTRTFSPLLLKEVPLNRFLLQFHYL